MPRALVVTRRTFCAPRCLRACAGWVCCPLFERGVRRVTVDALSASVASDTTADTTDATATATAEAVTEAVKRPQPDADSAADEQPDADTARPGQLARLNSPEPRPVDPGNARPVTAERRQREAQQPRPDAEALLRDAAGRFRVASQAVDATRRRADAAIVRLRRLFGPEEATEALGFPPAAAAPAAAASATAAAKDEAAVETADAARAANFYAHAASVCQRAAKDLEHEEQSKAADADEAASAARSRPSTHDAAVDEERRATEAREVVERARELANRAADVLDAARAAAVDADAKRQEAAAFAADHAAAAANAPGPNAAANAADAESATDDEIDDDDDDDDNLIAAASARDDNLIAAASARDDDVLPDEKRDKEKSIKCCLKSLLRLEGEQKTNFEAKIRQIVRIVSQLRVRAFQAMTLFCIRTLGEDDMPDEFFGSLVHGNGGDRFWREALRDPERRSGKPATPAMLLVREIRHSCGGPELEIPDGMSHILNSVARELSTAFRNHLSENFFERQLQRHRALVLQLHVATDGGIGHGTERERRKGIDELAHWLTRRVNIKASDSVDFSKRDRAATTRFEALGDEIKHKLREHVATERATLGLGDEDFVSKSRRTTSELSTFALDSAKPVLGRAARFLASSFAPAFRADPVSAR